MGSYAPSESSDSKRPVVYLPSLAEDEMESSGSSHEVLRPYSVSPHGAAALLAGFTSPDHLRLQVFSTS
jgi:hypothetical protein